MSFDFAELARRTARASQVGRDLDLVQEIVTEMRDVRVPEDRCDEDEYLADLGVLQLERERPDLANATSVTIELWEGRR